MATHVRAIEKSMEPTIRSGEFVEVDEYAYEDDGPDYWDIISLRPPASGDEELFCNETPPEGAPCSAPSGIGDGASFIKRVIALPGDTVSITAEGRPVVNGREQVEDYITPCKPADECELPEAITVPSRHYFVMGDNRPYSGDSRDFGPIPRAAVEGRVTPPAR